MSDYKKLWRIKNKEKIKAQSKKYRETHIEEIKLCKKKISEKHKENWKINGRPTYIYKIQLDDDLYIGSTYNISGRMCEHKYSLHTDRLLYNKIRELNCDFKMEIIEEFKTFNNKEKLQKEQEYILSIKPNLNEVKSYSTKEEKRLHNLNYMKQEYKNNPQKYLDMKKVDYQKHKDKRIAYSKEFYEKNKDKLNEKITCECGCIISKSRLPIHRKTQKHIKLMDCK